MIVEFAHCICDSLDIYFSEGFPRAGLLTKQVLNNRWIRNARKLDTEPWLIVVLISHCGCVEAGKQLSLEVFPLLGWCFANE